MRAKVGEWLIIEARILGGCRRQGRIVGVSKADGSPPYRVQWVEDDHESIVYPGPEARIEPHPVPPATGHRT
jgi:Domain of unknown function (DUF1918)